MDTSVLSGGASRTLAELLRSGATAEDDPTCRASNHFHNPLRPFRESMVTDLLPPIRVYCAGRGFGVLWSNVTWGTGHASPAESGVLTGNPFDWAAARRGYLDALTLGTPEARDSRLADTFMTLGHVLHLVQDLAVPAHARNDSASHVDPVMQREPVARWFENPFERFVRRTSAIVDAASATPIDVAGQRLTRFWDLDRYDGSNPSSDLAQGLAEYTNANFASGNTIFTEAVDAGDAYAFPFPRQSSTNLAALIQQSAVVPRQSEAEDRVVDLGLYLRKERDGEPIEHFLRAGYLTRDAIDNAPPEVLRLTFQFDDAVHRDYAALLVPRAIGYSAAVLDYFFRGKLDLDAVPDPDDPSVVRVEGMNASTDALVDGRLELYGDDPNGVRSPAATQDGPAVADVAVGGDLPSIGFRLPAETERLVAVYQGTLGLESRDEPHGFPGAVIGKVLGGVRVEQIFAEGGGWRIRTPKGVFALPLSTEEFEEVTWGDADDVIVARSAFGDDADNRISAYRLARRPGSVEFAVAGSTPLPVTPVDDVVFPFGMSLGTVVRFNETVRYRQRIARVDPVSVFWQWDGFLYAFDRAEGGAPVFETVHEQTIHHADQFEIVLDTFHHSFFLDSALSGDRRYTWGLVDVTTDAGGRLLGLVEVTIIRPAAGSSVPLLVVDAESGALKEGGRVAVPAFFPAGVNPLMWALIDLRNGRVVASTAEPEVVFESETAQEGPPWATGDPGSALGVAPGVWGRVSTVFVGGPRAGTEGPVWAPLDIGPFDPARVTAALEGEVSSTVGEQRIAVAGWQRQEIAAALPASYEIVNVEEVRRERAYLARTATEAYALTVVTEQGRYADHPPRLMEARRVRPVAGAERLVFLAERRGNDDLGAGHVVVWEPLQGRARIAADLPVDVHSLRGASSGAALVVTRTLPPTSRLVTLDGAQAMRAFDGDLSGTFTVLDPAYLYNVGDFRFYRPQEPLQATVLPARLAPGGPSDGDFHTIRVP